MATATATATGSNGKGLVPATLAVVATTLTLDLVWLGVVAKGFYDRELGALRAPSVEPVSAGLFYAMYVAAIVWHAVRGPGGVRDAALRGAGLGLVAYATYELTNRAVIAGWPAALVPVDIAWGVVLTATSGALGRFVLERWSRA